MRSDGVLNVAPDRELPSRAVQGIENLDLMAGRFEDYNENHRDAD